MDIKNKKKFIDLKYVNQSILLLKIGKYKVPAYSLLGLIILMIFQNLISFYLFLIFFIISIYLETNQYNYHIFFDIYKYFFQKKILFPTNKNKDNFKY